MVRTAIKISVTILGEICFEADPFVSIQRGACIPAILSIPSPSEIGRRVGITPKDLNSLWRNLGPSQTAEQHEEATEQGFLKHIPPLGFSITEDLTGQIAASGLIVAME